MGASIGLTAKELTRYGLADLILTAYKGPEVFAGAEARREHQAILDHFSAITAATDAVTGRALQGPRVKGFALPAEFFGRAMGVTPGGSGGYLVGTQIGGYIDVPRNRGILARLPVTTLDGLQHNVTLPRGVASVATTWVGEGTAVTASDPTLGSNSMAPRTNTVVTELSLPLMKAMGAAGNGYVQRLLARADAQARDVAFVNGAGAVEPIGMLNTAGVNSVSGSSLAWSGVLEMLKLAELYAEDDSITWLVAPDVAKLLRGRERPTGLGFIMEGNTIGGYPALVSNSMPAGSLLVAPWSGVTVATWGATELEVNPYQGFNTGKIGVRLLTEIDWVLEQPVTAAKATSIT